MSPVRCYERRHPARLSWRALIALHCVRRITKPVYSIFLKKNYLAVISRPRNCCGCRFVAQHSCNRTPVSILIVLIPMRRSSAGAMDAYSQLTQKFPLHHFIWKSSSHDLRLVPASSRNWLLGISSNWRPNIKNVQRLRSSRRGRGNQIDGLSPLQQWRPQDPLFPGRRTKKPRAIPTGKTSKLHLDGINDQPATSKW